MTWTPTPKSGEPANNYELMPTLLEDYFKNPTSSLLSISCDPWHHADSLVWYTHRTATPLLAHSRRYFPY